MILKLYSDRCDKKNEHEGAKFQQGLLDVEDFQLIFLPCGDTYFQTSTVAEVPPQMPMLSFPLEGTDPASGEIILEKQRSWIITLSGKYWRQKA